ncbi:MAG: hypothetical protein QOH18_1978, partial [Solirubrobacterales bacterium]|nr:hypothetical protein [Solirubrobacterales bacterium]
ITIADAQEAAKAHDGVFRFATRLVDHHIMNAAQLLAGSVVNACSVDLACRDKFAASLRRIFDVNHVDLLRARRIGNSPQPANCRTPRSLGQFRGGR